MTHTMELDDLLTHAAWLKRLARALAHEDADDVVQETWLTALRHRPDADRSPRPWLAEVARNLVRAGHRSRTRRVARELASEERVAVETPETLLARAQLQRQIVELVIALEEPLRTTVLLRYFEGLDATQIAAREHVAPATIRWRLAKALEQLRTKLDGERTDWRRVLVPMPIARPWGWGGVAASVGLAALVGTPAIVNRAHSEATQTAVAGRIATRAEIPAAATVASWTRAVQRATNTRPSVEVPLHTTAKEGSDAVPGVTEPPVAADHQYLDGDYMDTQLMSLLPALKQCQAESKARNPQHPVGVLFLGFWVESDPKIGGFIRDVGPAEGQTSTIQDPLLEDCLTNVLYGAELPPAETSGSNYVALPVVFPKK